MIIVYSLVDGQLDINKNFTGETLPKEAVWIDLVNPTLEEELFVEKALNINAPTKQEMKKIEVMSKSYQEGEASYMTSTLLTSKEQKYFTTNAVTFIVTKEHLVTLRYCEPKSFNIFADFAKAHPYVCISSDSVFEGLVGSIINRCADIIEIVSEDMNKLSTTVFTKRDPEKREQSKPLSSQELTDLLHEIGRIGDLTSKIRESLLSVDRMLIFFNQICENRLAKENLLKVKTMRTDINALSQQAEFHSHEAEFLLEATLGMINIQQNNIIKIFSVAAVVFLPPTLIASIYGMNFQHMPELDEKWGYPLAVVLMVISAILPYRYFKHRGWL